MFGLLGAFVASILGGEPEPQKVSMYDRMEVDEDDETTESFYDRRVREYIRNPNEEQATRTRE